MGFFNTIGRLLRAPDDSSLSERDRTRLLDAWGLAEVSRSEESESNATGKLIATDNASEYDRTQWQRRLRTILNGLPDSKDQWSDLNSDAAALGFDGEWVRTRQREEFELLVRRAVADGRFSPQEHRNIDLARVLLDLSEGEAEQIVTAIVGEAEEIFSREVEGKK